MALGASNLLFLGVSALVVFAVANGSESLLAVVTLVGLFPCVGTHMYEKVAFLCEYLTAVRFCALKQVLP